jgi:tRNA-specific 2-thiouridylase
MKKIFLGLSGGVDSSVSAALLKEQGYEVICVYMKNWSQDLPGMKCPWAEDLADAKRVATKLGLDFRVFDFEKDYKQKVVDYMLDEYKKGNTPKPDIMCNQEIKFKLFYEVAMEQGADLIATGHYAKVGESTSRLSRCLMRAADDNKDQTYFLYRISQEALEHTIFPLGEYKKPEVKKLAEKFNLHTAHKAESMGVCFVGEANMKDFLSEFIEAKPGDIIELETGQKLGIHDGAIFYTIGQRHGLGLTDGLPYYVVKKDMGKNIIYVSRKLNNEELWTNELELRDIFVRNNIDLGKEDIFVRLRHRAPLISASFVDNKLTFNEPIKRPASGQSAVFYGGPDAQICFGGGIIV